MDDETMHAVRLAVTAYLHRREHAARRAVRALGDITPGSAEEHRHPRVSAAAGDVALWHAAEAGGEWPTLVEQLAPHAWDHWAEALRTATPGVYVQVDGAPYVPTPATAGPEADQAAAEARAHLVALESYRVYLAGQVAAG